jgi:predicted transcriptional regulator
MDPDETKYLILKRFKDRFTPLTLNYGSLMYDYNMTSQEAENLIAEMEEEGLIKFEVKVFGLNLTLRITKKGEEFIKDREAKLNKSAPEEVKNSKHYRISLRAAIVFYGALFLILIAIYIFYDKIPEQVYILVVNFFLGQTTPSQWIVIAIALFISLIAGLFFIFTYIKSNIKRLFLILAFLFLILVFGLGRTAIQNMYGIQQITFTLHVANYTVPITCEDAIHTNFVEGSKLNCSGRIETSDRYIIDRVRVWLDDKEEPGSQENSGEINRSLADFWFELPVRNVSHLSININVMHLYDTQAKNDTWSGSSYNEVALYPIFTPKEYDGRNRDRILTIVSFFGILSTISAVLYKLYGSIPQEMR